MGREVRSPGIVHEVVVGVAVHLPPLVNSLSAVRIVSIATVFAVPLPLEVKGFARGADRSGSSD